jgi:hypothetical protein
MGFALTACAGGGQESGTAAGAQAESSAGSGGSGTEAEAPNGGNGGSGNGSGDASNGGFGLDPSVEVSGGADYEDPELPQEHQGQQAPTGAGRSFSTDFSRATISFDTVLSGGPPKDGIPAIDNPKFISIDDADSWLKPEEAVLVMRIENEGQTDTHIYPLQILMWHEIVNDVVAKTPVTVTYCPLCNTGVAFHRGFDDRVLDFGTTGRLRFSNLIMYDRQTETWWQQATGRGVAGKYAGGHLKLLPVLTVSWENAKERFPDAEVLSRETGYSRGYGSNPYRGYDRSSDPFLYRGPDVDSANEPMDRVLSVKRNGEWGAYTYKRLRSQRVIRDTVGGSDIVVFWQEGTASALDAGSVSGGRDVGSANAFVPKADGKNLEFSVENGSIVDEQTGSTWDVSGTAVSGPLQGEELEPVTGVQHFWFSWAAFRDAEIRDGS